MKSQKQIEMLCTSIKDFQEELEEEDKEIWQGALCALEWVIDKGAQMERALTVLRTSGRIKTTLI